MKHNNDGNKLVEVKSLKKHFPVRKGFFKKTTEYVKAVDGVDLYINERETLGLVGESGCGKTTLGRCIIRAIEPTEGIVNIRFPDSEKMVDIISLDKKSMRSVRKYMQLIFQDPYASLNPRMTVLDIVGEPLVSNKLLKGNKLNDRIKEMVRVVGLDVKHIKRYPHAFSGGQRQRIGIARALATKPAFIIADEAVSALDVSIQAQVLNLLKNIQKSFNLTFLFISHDLSVVEHVSDRVAVMYVGKIVELSKTEELFHKPKHPYTEALLSAVPKTDPGVKMDRLILPGEIPSPANPPSGCYFHPRCLYAKEICKNETPPWLEVQPEHFSLCHFACELNLKGVK